MTNTEKDWTGNKNSIFKTLGASNHTDKERENDDYYATDPIAIDVLILTSSPMLSSIIIFSVPGVSTQKNSDISL